MCIWPNFLTEGLPKKQAHWLACTLLHPDEINWCRECLFPSANAFSFFPVKKGSVKAPASKGWPSWICRTNLGEDAYASQASSA